MFSGPAAAKTWRNRSVICPLRPRHLDPATRIRVARCTDSRCFRASPVFGDMCDGALGGGLERYCAGVSISADPSPSCIGTRSPLLRHCRAVRLAALRASSPTARLHPTADLPSGWKTTLKSPDRSSRSARYAGSGPAWANGGCQLQPLDAQFAQVFAHAAEGRAGEQDPALDVADHVVRASSLRWGAPTQSGLRCIDAAERLNSLPNH